MRGGAEARGGAQRPGAGVRLLRQHLENRSWARKLRWDPEAGEGDGDGNGAWKLAEVGRWDPRSSPQAAGHSC